MVQVLEIPLQGRQGLVCHIPADPLRNNDIVITSKRRHFGVITPKWRCKHVTTTLLLCHVFDGTWPIPWLLMHWRLASPGQQQWQNSPVRPAATDGDARSRASVTTVWNTMISPQSTGTERSSGWQPWYSLETLKLVFNVSSEYQGCHADYLSVSELFQSHRFFFFKIMPFNAIWCTDAPFANTNQAWTSNNVCPIKNVTKLFIHCQTSVSPSLKFGNG